MLNAKTYENSEWERNYVCSHTNGLPIDKHLGRWHLFEMQNHLIVTLEMRAHNHFTLEQKGH